jgi:hypothetical protein
MPRSLLLATYKRCTLRTWGMQDRATSRITFSISVAQRVKEGFRTIALILDELDEGDEQSPWMGDDSQSIAPRELLVTCSLTATLFDSLKR